MQLSDIVVIRGGGDIATGVIQKFYRSGFKILVLEVEKPTAIRRNVALCEAVYTGSSKVEDVSCKRISSLSELATCYENDIVPVLVDPGGEIISNIKPAAVIDSILAKRNLGTHKQMAPVTIALGPGFRAGVDVDVVIETVRGHDLGRLILEGHAKPNTGMPGEIGGKSTERVIYAPIAGKVRQIRQIGEIVEAGEVVCEIVGKASEKMAKMTEVTEVTAVTTNFTGLLRGIIRELEVPKGMKIADIDPRLDINWQTISDKARCLGGATLEAFLYMRSKVV